VSGRIPLNPNWSSLFGCFRGCNMLCVYVPMCFRSGNVGVECVVYVVHGWFKEPHLADVDSGAAHRRGCTPGVHWVMEAHGINQPSPVMSAFATCSGCNTLPTLRWTGVFTSTCLPIIGGTRHIYFSGSGGAWQELSYNWHPMMQGLSNPDKGHTEGWPRTRRSPAHVESQPPPSSTGTSPLPGGRWRHWWGGPSGGQGDAAQQPPGASCPLEPSHSCPGPATPLPGGGEDGEDGGGWLFRSGPPEAQPSCRASSQHVQITLQHLCPPAKLS